MTPDVRTFDPADDTLLRGWWEVGAAAAVGRPIASWAPWEVFRLRYQTPRADGRTVLVAAPDAGQVVGAGRLFLFDHDNTHLDEIDVHVLPEHRRHGIGRAMLAERMPDRYVDGFLRLLEAFLGEVPTGDLDLRPAPGSVQRLRDHEDRAIATGTLRCTALAIAPDGGVAGFSDVNPDRADPGHARVGATLVLPDHRGHRLGMAMELASHRRVLERHPQCAYVETGNAGVNRAMNGVSERLGYRVVERCLDVQKPLA